MNALAEGSVFGGRYRVVRLIAAGGMGAVYEVVHIETERRRALKVMLPHVLNSSDLRERFQREAKVAAHVESDFIVDVFDAGYDEATSMPFLVMELLRGEELGKRLKRLGRLSPDEVITALHQASLALDKTHRAAIIHRDLKPENLFLTEREDGPPKIKVLDFGIAKVVAETTTAGATQSIGTPLYMAPEQFNPSAKLTGAADLYALAMVAYTLLVGAPYWGEETRGGNVFALAAVAIHGPREPASARAARRGVTLPPAFDAWFARATAANPAYRFPSGAEMVAALAQALGMVPPGRAPMASLSGPLSASGIQSGAVPMPTPVSAPVPMAAVSAPVPTMGTVYTPPQAPITAAGTSMTTSAPAGRKLGLAIGGAVALGVLIGLGVFVASRAGGDARSAMTTAGAASASAPPTPAAPSAMAVTATAEPVVSAGPTASASAAPPATAEKPAATAEKPAATAEKPAATATASKPAPTGQPHGHKYTRE